MEPTPGGELVSTDTVITIQAPPFKLMISNASAHLVALVALAADDVGRYTRQTEHWFAPESLTLGGNLLPSENDLTVNAVPLESETEDSLVEWVGSLIPTFDCRRQVSSTEWKMGVVGVAPDLTPHLFWMPHPDNALEVLGLLLVTDKSGCLVSTAWYRSRPPADDGLAFRADRFSGPLTLARDPGGSPSADPNVIRQGLWHYIVMPLP